MSSMYYQYYQDIESDATFESASPKSGLPMALARQRTWFWENSSSFTFALKISSLVFPPGSHPRLGSGVEMCAKSKTFQDTQGLWWF